MKKILVGMSGGVDSSVTAKMLLEQNMQVEGATMWLGEHSNHIIQRAQEIAKTLNIKHHVVDLSKVFKYNIIDEFIKEYSAGKTPIPCAKCNKEVKFGAFFAFADAMGFDGVATGHYIDIQKDKSGEIGIYRPIDAAKDQTHFLFWVNKRYFSRMLFPLGTFIKSNIKEISKDLNLGLETQEESQDICFLEGKGYVNFFETQNINQKQDLFKEGSIIKYPENEIVGKHKGVIRYTKGQRRNIGVSFEKPLYVMGVNKETNEVIVCEEEFLYKKKFSIKNINLNSISVMGKDTLNLKIATRAIKKTINAEIKINSSFSDNISAFVTLENGERAITEGQACVFYNQENTRMLGGGIIETIY